MVSLGFARRGSPQLDEEKKRGLGTFGSIWLEAGRHEKACFSWFSIRLVVSACQCLSVLFATYVAVCCIWWRTYWRCWRKLLLEEYCVGRQCGIVASLFCAWTMSQRSFLCEGHSSSSQKTGLSDGWIFEVMQREELCTSAKRRFKIVGVNEVSIDVVLEECVLF